MKKIMYGGAVIGDEEVRAIIRTINKDRRNWQANEEARKMEKEAARRMGVKYCVLTSSGSCAGLLALASLELPKGSEVIIPAVTFPTIFNIILQCGLTPVVVDSKIGSYNLEVSEIEQAISDKTKAIIAVHALGNPVDMPKLMKVAKKHKLIVLEDNCDGWGTTINGKWAGSFGDISFTSFHAAHIVSMGVGGGVFTDNKELAERVRMYRDWGRQANINKSENLKWPELPKDYNPRFIYEKIGYNFQILELQAAMGRVQLKKAGKIKQARQKNFEYLYTNLRKHKDLVLPYWLDEAKVCWFSFPITYMGDRSKLLKWLEKNGIETRPMFAGNITKHPAYKDIKFRIAGKLDEANFIMEHSFWISVHPTLTIKEKEFIINAFDTFFNEIAS